MTRVLAVVGGAVVGVAIMLGILQPWKHLPQPPAPPSPGVEARKSDLVDPAEDLIDQGKNEDARALLEKEPESARTLALLALVDLRSPNLISAQNRLAQAAALDPENFEVALVQGHLDMVRREFRAAVRSYTEALRRRPKAAKALAGRAAARFELKELAGAIEDATGALEAEPDALFTRAAAYGELNRTEESIRDWTAYLAKRPQDAQAWANRGNAHAKSSQKAAAVADWKQAVKCDPALADQLEPLMKD